MLIRRASGHPLRLEVLLGRRAGRTRFMPGLYVFPGGRVDPPDREASGFPEPRPRPPAGLDAPTCRRMTEFARAALRETWEETGLLIGRPGRARRTAGRPLWRAYTGAGLVPAFRDLRLFARAVTPETYPLRYHARYFLADGALARRVGRPNGELEDLAWIPLEELRRLPMPSVTRDVLRWALESRGASEALRRAGREGRFRCRGFS